jgi:hypothetical protein
VFHTHRFSLRQAADEDVTWLAAELDRESRAWGGTRVESGSGEMVLRW